MTTRLKRAKPFSHLTHTHTHTHTRRLSASFSPQFASFFNTLFNRPICIAFSQLPWPPLSPTVGFQLPEGKTLWLTSAKNGVWAELLNLIHSHVVLTTLGGRLP